MYCGTMSTWNGRWVAFHHESKCVHLGDEAHAMTPMRGSDDAAGAPDDAAAASTVWAISGSQVGPMSNHEPLSSGVCCLRLFTSVFVLVRVSSR